MDLYDLRYDISSSSFLFENDYFMVYAHSNEYLYDHMIKTCYIYNELVDNGILLHFYHIFIKNNIINLSFNEFIKIVECCIYFHDIGKLSLISKLIV